MYHFSKFTYIHVLKTLFNSPMDPRGWGGIKTCRLRLIPQKNSMYAPYNHFENLLKTLFMHILNFNVFSFLRHALFEEKEQEGHGQRFWYWPCFLGRHSWNTFLLEWVQRWTHDTTTNFSLNMTRCVLSIVTRGKGNLTSDLNVCSIIGVTPPPLRELCWYAWYPV